MSVIVFSPAIGPIAINVFVRERVETELGITAEPIETGAEVNDHSFVKPKRITLEIGDQNAAQTFNALVAFQETRIPFVMVTGLSVFKNMLISAIAVERDKDRSRVLSGTVELQEIIIVDTAYATDAEATQGDQQGKTANPGGAGSDKAANPSGSRAGDAATADRVSGTVQRGDNPTSAVGTTESGSVLFQLFGG